MKVLVTGGTGFVGCHAVAAMLNEGHDVRLLVRRPEQVAVSFAPLGVEFPGDVVTGDVTDAASVARAVEGCDAVVHAASVYSLDPKKAAAIGETNVKGTRNVIEAALAAGADPVVHVSSYVALLPARESGVHHDSPVGTGLGAYSRSKCESEQLAREYQERGEPVVTVMPGSVWGPFDPYFGESDQIATNFLKGRMRTLTSKGGVPIVDVRDVAKAIVGTVEPGKGPRRYLAAGNFVSSAEMGRKLSEVTGTKRTFVDMPPRLMTTSAGVFNLLARVAPIPLTGEMIRVGAQPRVTIDDSRALAELGYSVRPLEETMRDTVMSLVARGKLGKEAGRLAGG